MPIVIFYKGKGDCMAQIRKIALAVSALGFMGSHIVPAQAGEIDDLKAMMQQMQERIAQLEAKQKAAPAVAAPVNVPANAVVAGSMPGSIKVPGSETSLKVYGYVQLDMTKDFKGRNDDINSQIDTGLRDWQPYLRLSRKRRTNRPGQRE